MFQDCKDEILKAFEIGEDKSEEYNLHEVDQWDCLDAKGLSKKKWDTFVRDGDTIVLKNKADAISDELFKLQIYLTTTGRLVDCIPIGDLEISREAKYTELKDKICGMEMFGGEVIEECVRVR